MNDYTELKRLAEAAVGKTYSSGEKFFFSAEATPEQVLALIAENDSSRKHWQNESNNVQALMVEVARLKAENAGLQTGYEAYERVNAELNAETEALRKGAERYRWLQQWYIEGRKRSEIHPDGHICFTTPAIMDAAIDTALSKEASHG